MHLTLPNFLTLFRFGLLPLVVGLMWPSVHSPRSMFWATIFYVVAGLLDVVDGYVARRIGQVTAFGKFLDPLVDKLFHLVTLIAMLQLPGQWVPAWLVMVIVTRELLVTGLRAIASSEGLVIDASVGGKAKTTFATAGMCGLLLHYPYAIHLGVDAWVIDPHSVGLLLTYISVLLSVLSAVAYLRGFLSHLRR